MAFSVRRQLPIGDVDVRPQRATSVFLVVFIVIVDVVIVVDTVAVVVVTVVVVVVIVIIAVIVVIIAVILVVIVVVVVVVVGVVVVVDGVNRNAVGFDLNPEDRIVQDFQRFWFWRNCVRSFRFVDGASRYRPRRG